jgi:hypothetical protein
MRKPSIVILLVVIALSGGIYSAYTHYKAVHSSVNIEPETFDECAKLYPVLESYPRQCHTPHGKSFTEVIVDVQEEPVQTEVASGTASTTASTTLKQLSNGGCRPTGCGGELCADTNIDTICLHRPEYMCYKQASCGRQENGRCGWKPTQELAACLNQ